MEELDEDIKEFMVLKDLFQRTGMLHELQVQQLEILSSSILCAKETSVNLNFDESVLIFNVLKFHDKKIFRLFALKDRKPKDFLKRVQYVKKCVKFLLGNNIKVRVDVKGKEQY